MSKVGNQGYGRDCDDNHGNAYDGGNVNGKAYANGVCRPLARRPDEPSSNISADLTGIGEIGGAYVATGASLTRPPATWCMTKRTVEARSCISAITVRLRELRSRRLGRRLWPSRAH